MTLQAPEGVVTGRSAQRRRLAILALLALAPGRSRSRDKLMAMLWPEASEAEARHCLSGAIYDLRRRLGRGTLVTRGEDLWLDPESVACDVSEFEQALARDHAEEAVRLYRGPFLDGVHAGDTSDFEDWASGTRARLERAYRSGLEAVARDRAERGDARGAVQAWWMLAQEDRYSGRIELELIRALDASGDRAAAIRSAAMHAELLRTELGIDPLPEIDEWARRLPDTPLRRDGGARSPRGEPRSDGAFGGLLQGFDPDVPAAPTWGPSGPETVSTTLPRGAKRALTWRPVALTAMVATLGALTTVYGAQAWGRGGARPDAPPEVRVAVMPFQVVGDDDLRFLDSGMVDLLSLALDGAGDLRAVDPHALLAHLARAGGGNDPAVLREVAKRFGAKRYVVGTVVGAGGRVRILARSYETDASRRPDSSSTMRAVVEGEADGILRLVDELAAQLIAEGVETPGERPIRIAAMTTQSLPALKTYLSGESHLRSGRFAAAADSFRRAGERDTTFALAHYRHSLATLWADREGESTEDSDARALRHSDRLGERDRTLVTAYAAWRRGAADEAETAYRRYVVDYPDDVEAWFQLAETLFHYNPLRGRPISEARGALERVLALDPRHGGAMWHLALLAAHEGRWTEFRRHARGLEALSPDRAVATELRALRALASPNGDGLNRLAPELEALPPIRRSSLAWRTAVYFGRWPEADRILEPATTDPSPYWRVRASLDRADLRLARGRISEAEATLARLTWGPDLFLMTQDRRVLPAVIPSFARRPEDLLALEAEVGSSARAAIEAGSPWAEVLPPYEAYLRGLVQAALGDTAGVRDRVNALARLQSTTSEADNVRFLTATLSAHLAWAAGRPEEALRELDANAREVWYGWSLTSPLQSMAHERFLRAELLIELGREREAFQWYAGFGEHALHDLPYLAPSHFRRAQILERMGDAREAARHYARVVELWEGADPDTAGFAAEARKRLSSLRSGR